MSIISSATLLSNAPMVGAPSINFVPVPAGDVEDDASSKSSPKPAPQRSSTTILIMMEEDGLAPSSPRPEHYTTRSDTVAFAPARGRILAVTPECVEGALRRSSRHAKPARRFSPAIAPRAAAMKKLMLRMMKATRTATRAPVEVEEMEATTEGVEAAVATPRSAPIPLEEMASAVVAPVEPIAAIEGEEAALADPRCEVARQLLRATGGKNPHLRRHIVKQGGSGGCHKGFKYGPHFNVDVMYAHIRYGSTFPQWLVREAFLAANPEAEGMGLVPCDSTVQRAIDNFRNNNN